MLHKIALVNTSTVVEDAEVAEIGHALQHQINEDFRPVWFTNAEVIAVPKGQKPDASHWWIVVADDVEQAGALGYHDLTPAFAPTAIVGAKTDLEYNAKVSVTISHEALEMLGDPWINLLADDPNSRRSWAFENCDAVEADELGYDVHGQTMSDFVLPQFFMPQYEGKGEKLSHCGHVTEPFELAKGGYLSYRPYGSLEWKQITADGEEVDYTEGTQGWRGEGERYAGFPPGTRRERRVRAFNGDLLVSDAALAA
jgi:hypothetical protein